MSKYIYVSKLVCPVLIISSSVDSSYSGTYKLDKVHCGNRTIFINNVTSKVQYIKHAHMHTFVYKQIKGNLGNFNFEAKSVWKEDVHHDNMLKEHVQWSSS